jgi:UDP:flavonoid glycosyltransferase YjiC (YdhE family)
LGELPPNVRLTGFIPHLPVLEKAVLAISQAGHGLVMKCLYQGVPMVLVPWDRDQPGVAARAEALGVARVIPRSECSKSRAAEAIESVLDDSRFARSSAAHAGRIQGTNAFDQAWNRIKSLLGDGPS